MNNKKLDPATKRVLNQNLSDLTTPGGKTQYFDAIPLEDIFSLLKEQGLVVLQEDGTEWGGWLVGRSETASFEIAAINTMKDEGWGKVFQPIENASLVLQWHKMDETGNYEINAYVS